MIKICTSIEQFMQLIKLGINMNTSDMYWEYIGVPTLYVGQMIYDGSGEIIPAWSLAALLGVLPKIVNNETLFIETSAALWHVGYRNIYTTRADNPVDACYEMILKLHELNLL